MKSIIFLGIFCLICLQSNALHCMFSLYNNEGFLWSPEAKTDVLQISIDTTDLSTWNWAAPLSNGVMQKKYFYYYAANTEDCMDCVLSGYDKQGNLVTKERLRTRYRYKAEKCITSFSLECAYIGRGDFSGIGEYYGDGSDI